MQQFQFEVMQMSGAECLGAFQAITIEWVGFSVGMCLAFWLGMEGLGALVDLVRKIKNGHTDYELEN